MIIHSHIPKRKPKKPNVKARMLKASWQELLKKYDIKETKHKVSSIRDSGRVTRVGSDTRHIPSVDTGVGVAAKKPVQHYTGDAMIGIGQLHKSNAVPIFSQEEAIDISKMRRG